MAWEVAELVALYSEAQASHKLASGLEREILLVIAVAYDEKLDQSDKAVEYFRLAQRSSRRRSALEALERLYTRTERWSDLVDTLKKSWSFSRSRADSRPHRRYWERPSEIPTSHCAWKRRWVTTRAV